MPNAGAPVVAAIVHWDEVYPVVHLTATGYKYDVELTPIPTELAAEYASAYVAWQEIQRKLKRYLRELNERTTTTLAPAGTNKETS